MQFGFMPGRGIINTISILRQFLEKYLAKNRKLVKIVESMHRNTLKSCYR